MDYRSINRNFFKRSLRVTLVSTLSILNFGCPSGNNNPPPQANNNNNNSSNNSNSNVTNIGPFHLKVYDSLNNKLYDDLTPNSSLTLTTGVSYNFSIAQSGSSGTYTYSYTPLNSIGAQPISDQPVSNSIKAPDSAGIYKLTFKSGSGPSAIYTATVKCPNPIITKNDLSNLTITAKSTTSTTNNIYDLSVSNNRPNLNLTGVTCAWDYLGTGAIDSSYEDCTMLFSTSNGTYGTTSNTKAVTIPYFGTGSGTIQKRNIGLKVIDSCGYDFSVQKPVYITTKTPTPPFIQATTSAPVTTASPAPTDPRVYGVNFLATNQTNYPPLVSSKFNQNSNETNSSMIIAATVNYGQTGSIPFGVKLKISGITGRVSGDVSTDKLGFSTIPAISLESYSTDQAGNRSPAVNYSGGTCTLTNPQVIVTHPGQPCTTSITQTQAQLTPPVVEVSGSFQCKDVKTTAGATLTITGSFDGVDGTMINCAGGSKTIPGNANTSF